MDQKILVEDGHAPIVITAAAAECMMLRELLRRLVCAVYVHIEDDTQDSLDRLHQGCETVEGILEMMDRTVAVQG